MSLPSFNSTRCSVHNGLTFNPMRIDVELLHVVLCDNIYILRIPLLFLLTIKTDYV